MWRSYIARGGYILRKMLILQKLSNLYFITLTIFTCISRLKCQVKIKLKNLKELREGFKKKISIRGGRNFVSTFPSLGGVGVQNQRWKFPFFFYPFPKKAYYSFHVPFGIKIPTPCTEWTYVFLPSVMRTKACLSVLLRHIDNI